MTLEELRSQLDAHGGDPARWPADRRAAAEELAARDPDAAAALAEASALDGLILRALGGTHADDGDDGAGDDAAGDDAARVDRVVRIAMLTLPPRAPAAPPRLGRAAPAPGRFRPWLRTGGLVAAALAGLVVGSLDRPAGVTAMDITALALGPGLVESLFR